MHCRSMENMNIHAHTHMQNTAGGSPIPLARSLKNEQGSLQPHHSIFIMKAMDESGIFSSGGLKFSTMNECSTQRHIHKPICREKYSEIQANTHHQEIDQQTHKQAEKLNRTNKQSNKHTNNQNWNTNKRRKQKTTKTNEQTNKQQTNKQTNKQTNRQTNAIEAIEIKVNRQANKQTKPRDKPDSLKSSNK